MSQQLSTEKYLNAAIEANEQCASVEYSENALENGPAGRAGWTTGLTVICIFFLLIGLLGTASAGYGFYTLFGPQETAKERAKRLSAQPREMRDFQKKFEAAQDKLFPVFTYLEFMKLALALCFLAAVLMMVARSSKARSFAIGLCAMALVYHLCVLGANFWLLTESGGSLGQMFDSALSEARYQTGMSRAEQEQAKEMLVNSLSMGMTIGLAIVILVRLLFYGSVIAYLCQSEVKPIFGEDGLEYLKPNPNPDEAFAVSA